MNDICPICQARLENQVAYRGVCASCASRALAARPDLGPHAAAATSYAEILRAHRSGLIKGVLSLVMWTLQFFAFVWSTETGRGRPFAAWAVFGLAQVVFFVAGLRTIRRAQKATKAIGLQVHSRTAVVIIVTLAGIGCAMNLAILLLTPIFLVVVQGVRH